MNLSNLFRNYLFSSNLNIINTTFRFHPIFLKRFVLDFMLRVLIFLPFTVLFIIFLKSGYFKEMSDTMLASGQNAYGYLLVIFVYFPLFLLFFTSFFISILGSGLKRTAFVQKFNDDGDIEEVSVLPNSYQEAVIASWKNLWFLALETVLFFLVASFLLSFLTPNQIQSSELPFIVLKAIVSTFLSSGFLASLVSLPWLSFKKTKKVKELDSDNSNDDCNDNGKSKHSPDADLDVDTE